ncbi:MAG: S46 family peptidase [Prevotella sp.]|nr:S46 family peptidase [Prevotella sp.]
MKKILLSFVVALAAFQAKADEGMWTLFDLPQPVFQQMQAEGYALPYESLYEADNAVMKSVVNFGGFCSGVVVSPDGLVFTNHHCGFDAIRTHSTVEHDYMLNGFIANSYAEELPNENLFVSFMVAQKDITSLMDSLGVRNMPYSMIEELVDTVESVLSRQLREIDPTLRVEVKPFYEGNRYYVTTYRDFHDVRLVFAIPKSMGKFGGETDNWMWPRQTCDFSVFRVYADPDTNGPAEYSEKNVPYHPKHWAPVSMQGYKEGDFAMTMGYPGSTSRYLSSYGIKERYAENAARAQVRGVKQDVMIRHMRADEAVRIMYDSKYAQSSNYWKNSIGMNKCIDSIGLIGQKERFEDQLRRWQDQTGYLKGELDFYQMNYLYARRFNATRMFTLFQETFFADELSTRAFRACYGRMKVQGPEDNPEKQYIEFVDNRNEWDQATDCEIMGALLQNYREQALPQYLPDFYKYIDKEFGGDCTRYAEYLYKNSILMRSGEPIYINKKNYGRDRGVEYGVDLIDVLMSIMGEIRDGMSDIDEQEMKLCAAKLRMEQDMPNYSDANFTLRLSYGQIGGYTLGGTKSDYYTTASSMVDKMLLGERGVIDYEAEPEMKTLLSARDFGTYTDPRTGTMQLCFLSNNDITGGNSGSPVFNGKGELIGLAFDGNWDSLSSDIFFDRELARTISVDIRYVLFMMDRWGHADRLLREINAH